MKPHLLYSSTVEIRESRFPVRRIEDAIRFDRTHFYLTLACGHRVLVEVEECKVGDLAECEKCDA